jgi:hypothetical protein
MTCGWWVFLCSNFYAVKAKHGTLTALFLKNFVKNGFGKN